MPKKTEHRRRITITVRGDTEEALEDALLAAVRSIERDGNLSGHDSTDDGAYYFDSTDTVSDDDRPR